MSLSCYKKKGLRICHFAQALSSIILHPIIFCLKPYVFNSQSGYFRPVRQNYSSHETDLFVSRDGFIRLTGQKNPSHGMNSFTS